MQYFQEITINDFACSKPKCWFQPPFRARWETFSVPLKVRTMLEDVCCRRRSPMRQSGKSSVVLRCSTLRLSCRDLELDAMCRSVGGPRRVCVGLRRLGLIMLNYINS